MLFCYAKWSPPFKEEYAGECMNQFEKANHMFLLITIFGSEEYIFARGRWFFPQSHTLGSTLMKGELLIEEISSGNSLPIYRQEKDDKND